MAVVAVVVAVAVVAVEMVGVAVEMVGVAVMVGVAGFETRQTGDTLRT